MMRNLGLVRLLDFLLNDSAADLWRRFETVWAEFLEEDFVFVIFTNNRWLTINTLRNFSLTDFLLLFGDSLLHDVEFFVVDWLVDTKHLNILRIIKVQERLQLFCRKVLDVFFF